VIRQLFAGCSILGVCLVRRSGRCAFEVSTSAPENASRCRQRALRDPEPARAIVAGTFNLYARYPLLFLALALGVVMRYDLLVLIATGFGPLAKNRELGVNYLFAAFLVSPLISALHIHAVAEVHAGRTPQLRNIAARGLRVLPTAAATAIMATLGILAGFVLLIVPWIILAFRWYVAVQTAAIGHEGWLPALRQTCTST
jgi:hypothetical protein